jgi:biotin synthase
MPLTNVQNGLAIRTKHATHHAGPLLVVKQSSHGCHGVFTPLVASSRSTYYYSPVASHGYFPTESELALTGVAQAVFHKRAAAVTRKIFGKKVFVRAVVEVSNFCRENCAYCGMRRDNRSLVRYRARAEQIAELLIEHRPASVTDVNIQTGEDLVAVREVVLPLIEILRRETSLGISVCLGTLSPELYAELQAAGASIFIMKFESGDAAQYERIEAPGTLAERLWHVRLLAENKWNVSSGFIAGLPGQTPRDLLKNFELARSLPLSGCSVSPFIPGEDTPLAKNQTANSDWTFNCVGALRLMRPDWVIPAVSAFNLAAQDGYRRGLRAGANLVTINLTPTDVRGDYVIYKRDRFIMTEDRVLAAISAEGLAPSKQGLADFYRSRTVNGVVTEKFSETAVRA